MCADLPTRRSRANTGHSNLSFHSFTSSHSGYAGTVTSPRASSRSSPLRRLTASTATGGLLFAGLPLALDYVVRPGDTLSEIAARHDTSVTRLVRLNDLHASGDRIYASQTLTIPSAHGRDGGAGRDHRATGAAPDAPRVVHYTVRPGDTASGLAVRFHAWTAELIALNHLGDGHMLRVGDRIDIPVVVAAAEGDRPGQTPAAEPRPSRRQAVAEELADRADPGRATVRRVIERTARRYGVDPELALAVSWQEAGWQQHHVSHASAIGAMQVVPATGEWMSALLGRDLDLLDVHDNVTAGVVLLRELRAVASLRHTVAGYYQGLAGVREHGMYPDTKRYVANVLALKHRFERGDYPTG